MNDITTRILIFAIIALVVLCVVVVKRRRAKKGVEYNPVGLSLRGMGTVEIIDGKEVITRTDDLTVDAVFVSNK